MGWLEMRDMGGYATPRSYLDNLFTTVREDCRQTVLASAMVGSTYYAAVERLKANGDREVIAAVCLTSHKPRAADGYVFGYKSMDETMGPCESECPASILDELTATDREYALAWRTRCRKNAARRKLERAKPMPKPGQTIIFDEALTFTDGSVRDRFTVVANPKGRAPLYRDPATGALCHVSKIKTRSYRLINPAIVPGKASNG